MDVELTNATDFMFSTYILKSTTKQKVNIKFYFKRGKVFSDTYCMMKKAYGDNCLAHVKVIVKILMITKDLIVQKKVIVVEKFRESIAI